MVKTNIDQALEDIIFSSRKRRTNSRYTLSQNRARRFYTPNTYRRSYNDPYRVYKQRQSSYFYNPRSRPQPMSITQGIRLITNPNITKMNVSNLEFGVTQGDMRELFGSVGKLKHVALHFDKSGRSQGTCEIIFERRVDALKAYNQYNGVPLDGRSMCLELMGEPLANQSIDSNPIPQTNYQNNDRFRYGDSYRNGQTNGQINGNRTNGHGYKKFNEKKDGISAEDLDQELDAYLVKASKK